MFKVLLLVTLVLSLSAFRIRQSTRKVVGRDALNYPIRVGYIDRSASWYGDAIAAGMGTPGFAPDHDYNYILLAFWSCSGAPKDMAMIWASAWTYFAQGNTLGNNTDEIQKAIRKRFNDAGKKIMVSAFGDSENPTSAGSDPTACGYSLGNFVLNNNLDGADVDWQDNNAMNKGLGEEWLIKFTIALREVIPNHIVSHAPQTPYFKEEHYIHGAYMVIDRQVGHLIDFYMLQCYNQVDTRYDSYQELFVHATGSQFNGTAIAEIAARGVPLQKLVVGKPILPSDATNTGYVLQSDLGAWAEQAFIEYGWYAGIGHWQYPSDKTGAAIKASAGPLMQKCVQTGSCV